MGIVKQVGKKHFLEKYGYKFGTEPTDSHIKGYVNTYSHCGGLYVLWVTVCFATKRIYFYDEYDCCGKIWSATENIPKDLDIYNEHEFVEWLDEIVTYRLGLGD